MNTLKQLIPKHIIFVAHMYVCNSMPLISILWIIRKYYPMIVTKTHEE